MAIRLIVTIPAAPGRGAELAQLYKTRCAENYRRTRLRAVRGIPECGKSRQAGPAGTLDGPCSFGRALTTE